ANVELSKTLTRGRFINEPSGVAPNLFMFSVVGSTNVLGLSRPVICEIGQTLPVGVLLIDGLGPNDAPTLTPQGLDQFGFDALGRCVPTADGLPPAEEDACSILVDSENTAIEAPTLSSKPAQGTELARVDLVPALDDPNGARRWQTTLNAQQLVAKAAFGLTGFVGMGAPPTSGAFGGCDTTFSIPGFGDVLTCPPRTGGGGGAGLTNSDLGPGVAASDMTDPAEIPVSYVVPPIGDEATAQAMGLLPFTTYVVLSGNIPVTLENDEAEEIDDHVLNDVTGSDFFLGVFEYTGVGAEVAEVLPPSVTFEGIGNLPGIDDPTAFPLQVHAGDDAGDIPGNSVFRGGSFETEEDDDGDGIAARADNCVNVSNPDQIDGGRVNSILADRIGKVCQCADSVNDGQVEGADFEACEQALADGEDPTERCAVTQTTDFTIFDLVTLELKLSEGGTCDQGDLDGNACLSDQDCPGGGTCINLGEDTGAEVQQVCIPAVLLQTGE
ncbi:MAG: hypothetical protein ACYSU7_09385, partial [Planctomycetota bacterium]